MRRLQGEFFVADGDFYLFLVQALAVPVAEDEAFLVFGKVHGDEKLGADAVEFLVEGGRGAGGE